MLVVSATQSRNRRFFVQAQNNCTLCSEECYRQRCWSNAIQIYWYVSFKFHNFDIEVNLSLKNVFLLFKDRANPSTEGTEVPNSKTPQLPKAINDGRLGFSITTEQEKRKMCVHSLIPTKFTIYITIHLNFRPWMWKVIRKIGLFT